MDAEESKLLEDIESLQNEEAKTKYKGWIYILAKDQQKALQTLRHCKVIISKVKKYGNRLFLPGCIVPDYKLLEQYKNTVFRWQLTPINKKT